MTNADKIKKMSNAELADFLDKVSYFPCEICCNNLNKCRSNNAHEPICKYHFLDWIEENTQYDE